MLAKVPAGAVCDEHPEFHAVKRVQGESDSHGVEYIHMCCACYTEYKESLNIQPVVEGCCDWCDKVAPKLYKRRDPEEGKLGRHYNVCAACDNLGSRDISGDFDIEDPYNDQEPHLALESYND